MSTSIAPASTLNLTRSNVFKQAWELVKQAGKSLSEALKMAWSKFKKMDNKINFNQLSESQLKEAAFEALKECFARGGEAALHAVSLIEKVKEEFDQEEIRKARLKAEKEIADKKLAEQAIAEQERQHAIWAREKELATELSELLNCEDLYLTVWSSDGKGAIDKRIYLKTGAFFNGAEVATLYVTGNSKKTPMQFDTFKNKKVTFANDAKLKEILEKYSKNWKAGKFDISTALKYQGK